MPDSSHRETAEELVRLPIELGRSETDPFRRPSLEEYLHWCAERADLDGRKVLTPKRRLSVSFNRERAQTLSTMLDEVQSSFLGQLSIKPKYGVAVFFRPGTQQPAPFYFGQWQPKRERDWMKTRIAGIARLLRHNQYPLYGREGELAKGHVNDLPKCEHFFVLAITHAQLLAACPTMKRRDAAGRCGYLQSTIWCDPGGRKMTLPIHCESPGTAVPIAVLQWKPARLMPFFIASTVRLARKSYVVIASFFGKNEASTLRSLRRQRDGLVPVLLAHGAAAASAFTPIYHALSQELHETLRDKLGRTQISRDLLSNLAWSLGSQDRLLSYTWLREDHKGRKATLDLADLESDIHDDLYAQPDSLYTQVLRIQTSMYAQLRKEIARRVRPSSIRYLPSKSPLDGLLANVEAAQRAFRNRQRDHVVHQFQVFLVGVYLLNACDGTILRRILQEFRRERSVRDLIAVAERPDRRPGAKRSGPPLWTLQTDALLLKLAWFLAATFHDVGYPLEVVDDVVVRFRNQVGGLLGAASMLAGTQRVPRLMIDRVFQDDPRAAVLFRDFVKCLRANAADDVTRAWSEDQVTYFLMYLACVEKHHSTGSAFSLALSLLHGGGYGDDMKRWQTDIMHDFVCNNILVPILLHHVGEWPKIISDIRSGARWEECPKAGTGEEEDSQAREIGKLRHRAALRRHSLLQRLIPPKSERVFESKAFVDNPLAGLLALCDAVQEANRPRAQGSDDVECQCEDSYGPCWRHDEQVAIRLHLRYGRGEGVSTDVGVVHRKAVDVFKGKEKEIRSVYDVFGKPGGFMEHVCIVMDGNWDGKGGVTGAWVRRPVITCRKGCAQNCYYKGR